MAKYDIKRKDTKNKLYILEKYAPEETEDIYLLKLIIDNLKTNFKSFESGLGGNGSTIDRLRDDVNDYDYFYPYYQQVRKMCKKSILEVTGRPDIRYQIIDINDDKAIALSHDFFKEQGNFFYNPFTAYTLKMADHLKFIKPSKYCEGMMVYINCIDEGFVFVPGYRNITKFTILVHEIEHALDAINNPNFLKQFFVRETSAMFMELIGCDWIKEKNANTKDGSKRKLQIHLNVIDVAEVIYLKTQILNLIKQYPQLSNDELLKVLMEKYNYGEESLEYLSTYSLSSDYIYQVSYLIAIELYSLYQQDKEKALYILKYIILKGNNENIFNILKQFKVELTANLFQYEDNLCHDLPKKFSQK